MRNRLDAVVCNHANNFPISGKFHELTGLRALLIPIVENNAGESTQYIDQLKLQVWIQLQAAFEVATQRSASFYGSGRVVQDLDCYSER